MIKFFFSAFSGFLLEVMKSLTRSSDDGLGGLMNIRNELQAPDSPFIMGLVFHKVKTQRIVRKTSYDPVRIRPM